MYNEPNLKSQPVWPLIETGLEVQFKKIKANWKSIRDEALNVYSASSGGFINESESLKDTGYWGQFDLFIQGREKVQNCAKAPKTCALVKSIPQIKNNRRGQVKFSVMKSGTHVHAHSGPTNCRLRAHLGLKVCILDTFTHNAVSAYAISNNVIFQLSQKKNNGLGKCFLVQLCRK